MGQQHQRAPAGSVCASSARQRRRRCTSTRRRPLPRARPARRAAAAQSSECRPRRRRMRQVTGAHRRRSGSPPRLGFLTKPMPLSGSLRCALKWRLRSGATPLPLLPTCGGGGQAARRSGASQPAARGRAGASRRGAVARRLPRPTGSQRGPQLAVRRHVQPAAAPGEQGARRATHRGPAARCRRILQVGGDVLEVRRRLHLVERLVVPQQLPAAQARHTQQARGSQQGSLAPVSRQPQAPRIQSCAACRAAPSAQHPAAPSPQPPIAPNRPQSPPAAPPAPHLSASCSSKYSLSRSLLSSSRRSSFWRASLTTLRVMPRATSSPR